MVEAEEDYEDISEVDDEEFFVDAVTRGKEGSEWLLPLQINGTNIKIMLDTGSNVNILSVKEYQSPRNQPPLNSAKMRLTTYNGGDVPVKGECDLKDHT